MNYLALMKGLLTDAFSGIQYKKMPRLFSILAFVGVLPFYIAAVLYVILYYVFAFIYNALASSANYLERWLERKREGVSAASEAVLHLVCIPAIFLIHLILSIFAIGFYLLWFITECALYIASLGGIKWQPFINLANYDEAPAFYPTTSELVSKIFAIAAAVIAVPEMVFMLLVNLGVGSLEFTTFAMIYDVIYTVTMAISVPIIFKKSNDTAPDVNAKDMEDGEADELPEI